MYHSPYDFQSIMQFHNEAYSRGKSRFTIQARHNKKLALGGKKLSEMDLEKLRKMFCKDTTGKS